jgi:hypothetical protein
MVDVGDVGGFGNGGGVAATGVNHGPLECLEFEGAN